MDNWKVLNLGDISDIKRGLPSQDLNYVDSDVEGVRLIRINDFKSDTPKYIKESEKTKKLVVSKGDILIAGTGATAGISFLVEELWDGLPFSYNAPRIKVNKGNSSQFVYYVLNSEKIKIQQNKLFTGNAQPFLDTRAIASFKIPIPPLPEQQKIADILSTVDAKIDNIDQQITETQELKKGLMQRLLTKGIGHTEFKDSPLGEIPKSWEVVKQSEVATFYNGRAYKRTEWEETGIPVIRLQNLTGSGKDYYYSKLKLPEHQYCYQGDLLYMWSATFGPVWWFGDKAIYHYHIWKIEHDNKRLDKNFHFYLLDSVTSRMKNESHGSTMLHVTKGGMEKLPIQLPSLIEQKKISQILISIDEKLNVLSVKKETYQELKKGLMQQLLTGKIRVKV